MSKPLPSPLANPLLGRIDLKSRSGQILPYAIFGALVFGWVSSAHLDRFLSVYLTLLIAQLGTLGMYLFLRQLKSRKNPPIDFKSR